MPTFTKDGRTQTTDKPVLIVQMKAEGWREVHEPAAAPEAVAERIAVPAWIGAAAGVPADLSDASDAESSGDEPDPTTEEEAHHDGEDDPESGPRHPRTRGRHT